MKKKIYYVMIATALSLLLSACGSGKEAEDESVSTLSVEKNGKIISKIIEDFDEDYYYEDELKEMIETEVSAYNKQADTESITFNSCEKSENAVVVQMTYRTAEDYSKFNGEVFFFGTIQEAYKEGYDLNIRLTDAANTQTIGKDDILNMGDKHIIISNEKVRVSSYKDIGYTSEGVVLIGENKADLPAADTCSVLVLND